MKGADDRQPDDPARATALWTALFDPMRETFGVFDKVLSMTLADLLLGADPARRAQNR